MMIATSRAAATPTRRRTTSLSAAFVLVTGATTVGCGSGRRDAPLAKQPAAIEQPASDRLAYGKLVFDRHCYQCHPGGDGGLAPAINNKPVPAWLIKTQVRAGLGAMPSFSKKEIPDAELDAVAAYLLYLRSQKLSTASSGR
jgi:mono/diheme cytochrome c family protein